MKKSLIALAALAAVGVASAQSTVTLGGTLTMNAGSVEYGGAPSRLDIGRASGAVTLSGTEDLGGGLKASFTIQQGMYGWTSAGGAASTSLTGNTLGNFGDRQVFLTLSGGFGSIKIGRDLNGASTAPLSAGKVDGARAITGMDDNGKDAVYIGNVRATSLAYITPAISGFQAYVGITPQNYNNNNNGSASTTVLTTVTINNATGSGGITAQANTPGTSSTKADNPVAFGLTYSDGPIRAAIDHTKYEESISSLGNNGSTTSVGASYNLGVAVVGAVYQRAQGDAKADTKSSIFSVSVPMGSMSLGAAFGKRSATTSGSFSALETKHTQLSATYNLSKRTALFVLHNNKKVAGSTVDADDAKEVGVGIAHTF